MLLMLIVVVAWGCNPPPVENIFRKESFFPGGINVPVAFLVSEWGGKEKVLASGWLIEGGNGTLFSAKHFTDVFMNNIIELGANECKVFLSSKVYSCVVVRVPPQRDAVVLKILGHFNSADLPVPYKISKTKLKTGDKVFIQGFHPHLFKITKSNLEDGFKDLIVPILATFYELRMADPTKQKEVVFDSLEATVVSLNEHITIDHQESDSSEELKLKTNEYIKVITAKNHKFSFGGLSGGVVVKLNNQGVLEAVGIVTAEIPERLRYNKKGELEGGSVHEVVSDTLFITPIGSVQDLYDYARKIR